MKPIKRRNRPLTMTKILLAAASTIERVGVDKAGIDAIAVQAGVNKVLIYRYFGGWNGLIENLFRFMMGQIFAKAQTSSVPNQNQLFMSYCRYFYQELTTNATLKSLLIWQLLNQSAEVSKRFKRIQAASLDELFSHIPVAQPDRMTVGLLIDGLTHQILKGDEQTASQFLNMALPLI